MTKYYIRVEYQSGTDADKPYEVSKYREVESTVTGDNTVWSFKSGGDTKVFDGDTQVTVSEYESSETFEVVLAISSDATTGTYWAYEAITGNYKALELEGLAVYEKDVSGTTVRYEHDTLLETLTPVSYTHLTLPTKA